MYKTYRVKKASTFLSKDPSKLAISTFSSSYFRATKYAFRESLVKVSTSDHSLRAI